MKMNNVVDSAELRKPKLPSAKNVEVHHPRDVSSLITIWCCIHGRLD